MCNPSCLAFGITHLGSKDVSEKRVLEVGALNVNGSLRSFAESLRPREYVGVDLEIGPGVEEICDAARLVARFGRSSFDVVISTELLEHIKDWRSVVSNLKQALAPGGILLLTTRSKGYPYHDAPSDFWRFELEDMKVIFNDLRIEALEPDPEAPGVFLKARKPLSFKEADISKYQLYSMIKWKRVTGVTNLDVWSYGFRYLVRHYASIALPKSAKAMIKEKVLHE